MPTRPVVVSDILSFNTQPDDKADLMLCNVKWQQGLQDRSEKYYVFKAVNVSAGDTDFAVPVFVQQSYYEQRWGNVTEEIMSFIVTAEDFQYGQRNAEGDDRFIVLHDQKNEPYQHRFVASWLIKLANKGHALACAQGYAAYADKIDDLGKTYLGDPLHSFKPPATQSGDVLLVPSKLPFFSFGTEKTIEWAQKLKQRSAKYYSFEVVNTTQKGQDVMFFIQKEWFDSDSTAEQHISKIATKNADGKYELKIDAKCQYGQADKDGKGRWVVFHDKERTPYQHRFVKSTLHSGVASAAQLQTLASSFGLSTGGMNIAEILKPVESIFGNYLHTFN